MGPHERHPQRQRQDSALVPHRHRRARQTVVTDGWSAYPKACEDWFTHEPYPVARSGHQAHELLPAVHRVASLCKRWLMGTHQGGVQPEHLQAYLEELCFRFNRRHARARGLLFYRLLQYAAGAAPVTYRKMVATSRPQGRQTGRGQGPTFQAGHPRAAARGPTLARCSQLGVVTNRQTCAPGSETDSPQDEFSQRGAYAPPRGLRGPPSYAWTPWPRCAPGRAGPRDRRAWTASP